MQIIRRQNLFPKGLHSGKLEVCMDFCRNTKGGKDRERKFLRLAFEQSYEFCDFILGEVHILSNKTLRFTLNTIHSFLKEIL
jgi:hypothetical protein